MHKGDPSQPLASIGRTGSRGLWRVGHRTSRSASACWEHGGKMARSHMDPDHIIMRPQHFGPLLTYLLLSSHKTGAVFEQTLLGVVKADDRLLELRCGRVDVSLFHEELVLSKGGRSRASSRRWWRASSLAAATAGAIQLRHLEDCCRIAGRHASVPRILQAVAWKQLLGTRRHRLLHEKAVHLAARSVRLLAGFSGVPPCGSMHPTAPKVANIRQLKLYQLVWVRFNCSAASRAARESKPLSSL